MKFKNHSLVFVNGQLYILRVRAFNFPNHFVFLLLKTDFVLANSADPDEMSRSAAFDLGLHACKSACLGYSSLQKVNPFKPN